MIKTIKNYKHILLYIFLMYVSAECLAKLLHEFGHAGYAIIKGSSIGDIVIHVNPFSGGFTRIASLNLDGNLDIYLFGLSGAFLPVMIGIFALVRSINNDSISILKLALLGGYGLLGNGVNLLAGLFIKSSDGGGMLKYGFPVIALIGIGVAISGLGIHLLINKFFKICLKNCFTSKIEKAGFLLTLYVPACLSLIVSLILHDLLRRRLFFSGVEVLLFTILFFISLLISKNRDKEVNSIQIPVNEWIIVIFGVVISAYCLVDYGIAIFYALSGGLY